MQNIKDLGSTVVVGAIFVICIIIIWKWLTQKRLFSRKEFNPKELPALFTIFFLAVCYFSGMFLEITSDYAIRDSSYILPMPLFPDEDSMKVEVLFQNNYCFNLTPLGREVFKANLFSKHGEKRDEEKLEKLKEVIVNSDPNDNFRRLIRRTYGKFSFQQIQIILKNTTFNIYYNGKNTVYREENYFKEMTNIQQRIDFIRSISMGFEILAILLIFGNLVLIVCLLINLRSPKLFSGLFEWLKLSRMLKYKNERIRTTVVVTKIIKRSVIILIILIVLYLITIPIFEHEEKQFNKRIFGYFIKLDSLQKNEHMQTINIDNN